MGQFSLALLVDKQDSAAGVPFPVISFQLFPCSAACLSLVQLLFACRASFTSSFLFRVHLSFMHQIINLIFRSVTLFPLSVTGRCGWRTTVSPSPTNSVSLEFLPVSHTALLFTAFRQRIKEVCHATSWIRNGVWLPFVLHRNLALGRPSA